MRVIETFYLKHRPFSSFLRKCEFEFFLIFFIFGNEAEAGLHTTVAVNAIAVVGLCADVFTTALGVVQVESWNLEPALLVERHVVVGLENCSPLDELIVPGIVELRSTGPV